MALIVNGVTVEKVICNGTELDKVIANGVEVFTKAAAGYTVTVSWSDDYSLWRSLQYSTDSGSTWITMPGYEAGSGGSATLAEITGKIRFKVSGDGGTCAVWKDGTYTGNTITLDGQSPDYTLTANASFELIGSD